MMMHVVVEVVVVVVVEVIEVVVVEVVVVVVNSNDAYSNDYNDNFG